MNRRLLMLAGAVLPMTGFSFFDRVEAEETFEVTRTDAEWRAMLTPAEYRVMREEGTERAGSSPLDKLYAPGAYHCRGCDLAVYSAEAKYDSGTGWPSFWEALPGAVGTKPDGGPCSRCGRKCTAAAAGATLATSSMTARRRRASGTA